MPAALLLVALAFLAGLPTTARADGIFVADCAFSHRASHDPIVFHDMPGASHSHEFFGNRSTRASSTLRSLRRSAGNCLPAADRSAYWTPTLYRHGRPLRAVQVQAYYQDFFRYGRVLPFPPGLRVVAGRATATRPQRGVARWTCRDDHGEGAATPPACGPRFVTLRITFPDCWDGRRLDSPDHQSHMAYNRAGGMVLGPQRSPRATRSSFRSYRPNVVYPVHDGNGLTLASGSGLVRARRLLQRLEAVGAPAPGERRLERREGVDDYLGCATISAPNTEPVTARPRARLIDRFYPPPDAPRHQHPRHH